MADFLRDTSVAPDAGREGVYHATLSPEWAVWGPNGGYVAAIALRAALTASHLPRPASFQAHFLAVGGFAPVEVRVARLGGGKRAESLRSDVWQGERQLLAASVWTVDDGLGGYAHDVAEAPAVPGPDALRSYAELESDSYASWYPIWRSMEGRPTRWREPPGRPESRTWLRFTDTVVSDRAGDALRQLFWLDYPGWNATIAAHPWPFPYLTPNLDLTVQFHRSAPEADWMLADGFVPLAGDGLLGCVSRLWTADGRLLATGTSTHACRRNPGYEEELARAKAEGLLP